MDIILVGGGEVGYSLAERLTEENHNVVVIDKNEEALERAGDNLDVMTIEGSAASVTMLNEAGARDADILIAVTDSDEMNMICCLLAKRLGVKKTVARIRNPEYEHEHYMLHEELEIDVIINPERMAAMEISRLLRFPLAMNIESFCKGRVEMIEFRAKPDDPFIGKTLMELSNTKLKKTPVLFSAIVRNGESFIPNGGSRILEGDYVYVMGEAAHITTFFKHVGRSGHDTVRNVMILGGGRASFYLCRIITHMGIKARVVEKDAAKCERFYETMPQVLVLHADGTDQELLDAEGIHNMDAFVALTSRDEVNIISSMYAAHSGVPKIITHIRTLSYYNILNNTNVDNSIISTKTIIADHIARLVRGLQGGADSEQIQALYSIGDEHMEVIEFTACESMRCIGQKLKGLRLQDNILVGALMRGKQVVIPGGEDSIQAGDNVIIVAKDRKLRHLDDILRVL